MPSNFACDGCSATFSVPLRGTLMESWGIVSPLLGIGTHQTPWARFYTDVQYCATPTEFPEGIPGKWRQTMGETIRNILASVVGSTILATLITDLLARR